MDNDKQVNFFNKASDQYRKEEDLEMIGRLEEDELLEDVLDEVLSEDDDDDEDNGDLGPRGAQVQRNVFEAMQGAQQRQLEPVGVLQVQESDMDVDVHVNAPNRPAEGQQQPQNGLNTKAAVIDNEPPIEGYAR